MSTFPKHIPMGADEMALPNLSVGQVQSILPEVSDIEELDRGGQKVVFTGIVDGRKYALKFMSPNPSSASTEESDSLDDVTSRAQREVETMQQCSTPHLVRMGPIGLGTAVVNGASIIYFSEEFVEGKNLRAYQKECGNFSSHKLIKLARHISEAIDAIWKFSKIHRDIKPGNIMRRDDNGEFVLLDMGLVFDLQDESLSVCPVGTPLYFSPEQMDFNNRRTMMNFRSDLFSLGTVMYELATGKHPFVASASTTWDVLGNIVNLHPPPPIDICPSLAQPVNDIIMRLLAKRPSLRYRSISLFQRALREAEEDGGE